MRWQKTALAILLLVLALAGLLMQCGPDIEQEPCPPGTCSLTAPAK